MLLCDMRWDGMTIRAVAPPGAATADDVDTIRYASPISGYPRTVPCSHQGTAACPLPWKMLTASRGTVEGLGRGRARAGRLTAGWIAVVGRRRPKTHQGAVHGQRVRSTCWASQRHPWTSLNDPAAVAIIMRWAPEVLRGYRRSAVGRRLQLQCGGGNQTKRTNGRTDVYGRSMTVDVAGPFNDVHSFSGWFGHSVGEAVLCACIVVVSRCWLWLHLANTTRTTVCSGHFDDVTINKWAMT